MIKYNNAIAGMGLRTDGIGWQETSIESLTQGASIDGMRMYISNLNSNLLVKVKELLESKDEVVGAISDGWQGHSRDVFLKDFYDCINKIENALDSEFNDLQNRLMDLLSNYFEQDKNLMDE